MIMKTIVKSESDVGSNVKYDVCQNSKGVLLSSESHSTSNLFVIGVLLLSSLIFLSFESRNSFCFKHDQVFFKYVVIYRLKKVKWKTSSNFFDKHVDKFIVQLSSEKIS